MKHLLCVMCVLAFAAGREAWAAKAKKSKPVAAPAAVVFAPTAKDPAAQPFADAVSTELDRLAGETLPMPIKPQPADGVSRCKAKLPCIAKLAKKAKATQTVIMQAKPTNDGGAEITLAGFGKKPKIEQTASFIAKIPGEVPSLLAPKLADVLGVPELAGFAQAAAPAPPPPAPAAAPATPAANEGLVFGDPAPAPASTPVAAETPPPKALEPPPPVEAIVKPAKSKGPNKPLLVTGIVVGVLGLGAVGAGSYFGLATNNTRASITDTTPQTLVDERARAANGSATMANILWGAGGGVAAVGVALVVTSFIVGRGDSVAVTPLAGGAHVAYGGSW